MAEYGQGLIPDEEFFGDVWDSLIGTGEHMARGMGGMAWGGLRGLTAPLRGADAEEEVRAGMEQFASDEEPNIPTQRTMGLLGDIFTPIDEGLQDAGGWVAEKTGSPGAGTAFYTGMNALLMLANPTKLTGSGLIGAAKAANPAVRTLTGGAVKDIVSPVAKFVTPKGRYSMMNPAMGQLIARQQLPGARAGTVQSSKSTMPRKPEDILDDTGLHEKGAYGWYNDKGGVGFQVKYLESIGKQAEADKLRQSAAKASKEGINIPDWANTKIMRKINNIYKQVGGIRGAMHFPKARHLMEMFKTGAWRNPGTEFSSTQNLWLRENYGITGNVYNELERLRHIVSRADDQLRAVEAEGLPGKGSNFYRDRSGNEVHPETPKQGNKAGQPLEINEVRTAALENFHAQIAYNRSILEKFNPGDPRLKNLTPENLDRYMAPNNKIMTAVEMEGPKGAQAIVEMLDLQNAPFTKDMQMSLIRGGDYGAPGINWEGLIQNHLTPSLIKELGESRVNVNLSSKPFFMKSVHNELLSAKASPDYITPIREIMTETPLIGEKALLDAIGNTSKLDRSHAKGNLKVDDDWVSISQPLRTNDTLLATITVRAFFNRKDPSKGFYVLSDRMRQGVGVKSIDTMLDAGSDTSRIYFDVRPFEHQGPLSVPSVMTRMDDMHKVDSGTFEGGAKAGQQRPVKLMGTKELQENVMKGTQFSDAPDNLMMSHMFGKGLHETPGKFMSQYRDRMTNRFPRAANIMASKLPAGIYQQSLFDERERLR